MELVEVKCKNCSKKIYIMKGHVREKMFCTLACMDRYSENLVSSHFNSPTISATG
ncbi:MAG: hypothetical protein SCH70_03850 [Candidatus Methanoperedens sp.]|nr:hypothetical protein [Candidatus Methanoperedens sp.]